MKILSGSGPGINIPEGGRWGAQRKKATINSIVGMIEPAFKKSKSADPATIHWITQIENILIQSFTEQTAYDFKQGFCKLDGSKKFDEKSFEKILKTCVGIANFGRSYKGYVLVGVAEDERTTNRVSEQFGVTPKTY